MVIVLPFTYEFSRPALTVDCVIFAWDGPELKILLIRRGLAPFKGKWALPGGFVRTDESLDEAARRELQEETGLSGVFLEQLFTFGEISRDPRERVVSVAYYALVNLPRQTVKGATDADDAAWFAISELPTLAFDHEKILTAGLARLRGKVRYEPIGFELLPEKFTLGELQRFYETVLERALDKRNFRKKILAMGVLIETDEVQKDVAHRAARLYRFDAPRYQKLRRKGFHFEV